MKKIIVAIDGFSSCGKSTMAKDLARYAGYVYVDTGAMYRAVALLAIENGWLTEDYIDEENLQKNISQIKIFFKNNAAGVQETYLNGRNVEREIRTLKVANGASRISALGFVRHQMVSQQQLMGAEKGIVMDGRDIGTVVFPQAELKIFVTARAEVRAMRRMKELQQKGQKPVFEQVFANIKERDLRDTTRTESPLKQADDAILIDNSDITRAEQQKILEKLFKERTELDIQ
ncbi:MAG: (d)CMP kinase [Paludibacter sp.]|nr:(d)CMP kinase [Paludibacter sp.]